MQYSLVMDRASAGGQRASDRPIFPKFAWTNNDICTRVVVRRFVCQNALPMRLGDEHHAALIGIYVLQRYPERQFMMQEAGIAVRLVLVAGCSDTDARRLQQNIIGT
jgi:hypothetical protein